MENETRVNKINKIENPGINLKSYEKNNKKNKDLSSNQNFSDNLQEEMDKYKEKIKDIKEKEMMCAVDLLIEDFNIDEVVQIFEFSYQEFYDFINNKLKIQNINMYNFVIQKINKDKYERTKHK